MAWGPQADRGSSPRRSLTALTQGKDNEKNQLQKPGLEVPNRRTIQKQFEFH